MRTGTRTTLILGLIALGAASCSQPVKDKSPDLGPPTTGPVLVQIVGRDVTIVARAGAAGPIYSVQSKDGQTLVPAATLDELQASEPTLARHIQSLHADNNSGAWAGLE